MTLHEIQQKLADKQATDVILGLPAEVIEGRVWRNTNDHDCAWEVKYLRLRGMLMHHDKGPHLVAIRGKQ